MVELRNYEPALCVFQSSPCKVIQCVKFRKWALSPSSWGWWQQWWWLWWVWAHEVMTEAGGFYPAPEFQVRGAEDMAGVFDIDLDQPEGAGSEDELEAGNL